MTRLPSHADGAIGRWEIQLRKGVLEFVVLMSLRERERYGFELIAAVERHATLQLPEGTLYPLLLRLAKDGLITSRLAEGDGGAPRKYFSLTPAGGQLLDAMILSWWRLSSSVDRMIARVAQ